MEEKEKAIDGAPVAVLDDNEVKIASLEAEKARLTEEAANYKLAFLKEKAKKDEGLEPDEDKRLEIAAKKALAESHLADVARELDEMNKKILKENKELKAARLNDKKDPPAGIGTHSESQAVKDTLVTPEQMAAFKTRGWTDKDIERYKKNYLKFSGR